MRIAIVTSGRFWLLDLARELSALGHDVRFHSCVPRSRAERFGLPASAHRSGLLVALPLLLAQRKASPAMALRLDRWMQRVIDRLAVKLLDPCHVFIGLSGLSVLSMRRAKEKFGALTILERGSRHVSSQQRILEAIPGVRLPAVPAFAVARELWGYSFADFVMLPSLHVMRSFVEEGLPIERLLRNPYGVDLAMFPPTARSSAPKPTIAFAGTWSLRKGCDILGQAIRGQGWRLIHVGAMGDAPEPYGVDFEHRGIVPQWELPRFYADADVFVHASREEGLSLVQAQALACGLPLVCTDRTGGEDLREFLDDRQWVKVVPSDDIVGLRDGIARALMYAGRQSGLRDILGPARARLSWRAYGERYHAELLRRVPNAGA